jgi:hypothetical protein
VNYILPQGGYELLYPNAVNGNCGSLNPDGYATQTAAMADTAAFTYGAKILFVVGGDSTLSNYAAIMYCTMAYLITQYNAAIEPVNEPDNSQTGPGYGGGDFTSWGATSLIEDGLYLSEYAYHNVTGRLDPIVAGAFFNPAGWYSPGCSRNVNPGASSPYTSSGYAASVVCKLESDTDPATGRLYSKEVAAWSYHNYDDAGRAGANGANGTPCKSANDSWANCHISEVSGEPASQYFEYNLANNYLGYRPAIWNTESGNASGNFSYPADASSADEMLYGVAQGWVDKVFEYGFHSTGVFGGLLNTSQQPRASWCIYDGMTYVNATAGWCTGNY